MDDFEVVRGWLTTVGGLLALGVASLTYALNSRNKREEQARLVYSHPTVLSQEEPGNRIELYPAGVEASAASGGVKFEFDSDGYASGFAVVERLTTHAIVKVENRSKEVVGPVCVRLSYVDGEWEESPGVVLAAIPPESSSLVCLTGSDDSSHRGRLVCSMVLFRDSAGRWWKRKKVDPIEPLRRDPGLVPTISLTGTKSVSFGTGFSPFVGRPTWRRPTRRTRNDRARDRAIRRLTKGE